MAALLRSHGAPPLVDDERWVPELARPEAILMVSDHSEAAPLVVDGFWMGLAKRSIQLV
jgi:4,5-DOPA dioxygenase extradiol